VEFLSQTALRGLYRDCRYSGYGTTASIAIKSLVPPSNFARRWPRNRRPLLWGILWGVSVIFSHHSMLPGNPWRIQKPLVCLSTPSNYTAPLHCNDV